MAVKVTMQDIADALGLSRNTVSKAINNTGVIADNTKELILKKAAEMGYRSLSGSGSIGENPVQSGQPYGSATGSRREIAMLTRSMPGDSHFAVTTLDRMQKIFSGCGYSLVFYRVTDEELGDCRLPGSLNLNTVAAVFCMELFDYDYCRMLTEQGVPLLLIDSPLCIGKEPLPADILMMENALGIHTFVRMLADKGKKSVGFVGNMTHCRSFFERGGACLSAAAVCGFPPAEKYSILHFPPKPDPASISSYTNDSEYLYKCLQELPQLPDAFICANDFIAVNLIGCLRRMGVHCPGDILILGFDDSPEARYHSPSLSTVHIHTQAMGDLAAELLLTRIANPAREPRSTYSLTDLLLRESTSEPE